MKHCYVCGTALSLGQVVWTPAGPNRLSEPHCRDCAGGAVA